MELMVPWEAGMLEMGLQLRYVDIKHLDSVFMQGTESKREIYLWA